MAKPSGVLSKKSFIVGAVGAAISAFAVILMLLSATSLSLSDVFFGGPVGMILLGVGLILAGIGYRGIKKNYGLRTGTVGFALSLVAAIFLFANIAINFAAQMFLPSEDYWLNNPLLLVYILESVITIILFGVMQILWGFAHVKARHYTKRSGLSTATGIIFIVSGALTAAPFLPFVLDVWSLSVTGIVLFLIPVTLSVMVFLSVSVRQQAV